MSTRRKAAVAASMVGGVALLAALGGGEVKAPVEAPAIEVPPAPRRLCLEGQRVIRRVGPSAVCAVILEDGGLQEP